MAGTGGFRRVSRERLLGLEVQVALDRQAKLPAQRSEFGQAHGAKFWKPHTEVAEAKGDIGVLGVDFGQKPGASRRPA